ncbi:MAG TPA: hypothetical protein VFS21_27090, partial [Roseiflexaceae bacterium]|nr:hypothetical protein [Roseiflexaceae bacterium]
MTDVNIPFELPDKRRVWLRFNYLTIPYDADKNDFYGDDPILLLVLCEVQGWDALGLDKATVEILFPTGVPEDVTQSKNRGYRIGASGIGTVLSDKDLIIPVGFCYCAYHVMNQTTQKKPFSEAISAFKISVLPEIKDGLDFPSQIDKQERRLKEYERLREIVIDAENKVLGIQAVIDFLELFDNDDINKIDPGFIINPDLVRNAIDVLDIVSKILDPNKRQDKWELKVLPAYSEGMFQTLNSESAKNTDLIYLFNIIVALEWTPDKEDRRQLAWAFKQASDFLYDISNGSLAFGQVIFATKKDGKLMQLADIVIAASNRFQGRSWVGSIHQPNKRMPLRIGRGEWRRSLSIPWDEPEGYRVIVHEWAHYALHLRDAYLNQMAVKYIKGNNEIDRDENPTSQDPSFERGHITTPNPYLVNSTVMEALDGTSELSMWHNRANLSEPSERQLLHVLYPSKLNQPNDRKDGPLQMRLPLPNIVFEEDISKKPLRFINISHILKAPNNNDPNFIYFRDPTIAPDKANDHSIYDQCWLYILRQNTENVGKSKLIAQGTLERRFNKDPFRLIEAEKGDMLIAVIDRLEGPMRV